MSGAIKSRLVNSRLGSVALASRERFEMLATALRRPEQVGTIANDQIARVLLEQLSRPGGGFVDVGAHIGSVIAGVQRHGRAGRIIACEAMPDKAAALKARFPPVMVLAYAIGDEDGEATFYVDRARPGFSSLYTDQPDQRQAITVPVRRLDTILPEMSIDLIKVDVEGGELGVFRGADSLIARNRPVIMFESGPEVVGGFTKENLWSWLYQRDFEIVVPNRLAHNGEGLDQVGFLEAHDFPRRTTNYFAVPRERRSEVRDRARNILV